MIHSLKTWPEYFEAVRTGRKTFEIRRNDDRNFQVGDWLQLEEWCPNTQSYSGRGVVSQVTYITDWEQKPGYIVMAITPPQMFSEVRGAWTSPNSELSR